MNERRRQDRFETEQWYRVVDRDTGDQIGDLTNLSEDGAMFITEEPIETSASFKCRMELPESIENQTEVTFDAECMWSNQINGWSECGVKLLNISEVDASIMGYLMYQVMKEQSPT